ncbi:MAG: Inner-rane translocator [Streptosporangiaceae bacterium]|jgi:branched-chain amino acid transport system permease protein|nr:Inner-rane translocator [Streptosporangiaceae bacterium]
MNLKTAIDKPSASVNDLRDRWADAQWYVRWPVYVVIVLLAIFVLPLDGVAQFMSPDVDWASILFYPIGGYILLALGLNIVVGMAGLLDLGYVAFFAIGAYSVAYLGRIEHWNFWPAVLMGVLLSAFAGIVLGAPTLRLRGDYLAIVTLGFGEIVRIVALNTDKIGGAQGIDQIPQPPDFLGLTFGLDALPYYYLMVVFIIIVIIVTKRLERSRVGRAWSAIREDEDAAELMGVPTFKFKLLAFFVGAMVGGLGGAGTIGGQGPSAYIQPQNFPFILSATILVCVVFGGSGNIPGVILGSFIVAWLPERLRFLQDYRIMIFGAVLVVMMIFRPEGLLPSRRRKAELAEGTGGMGSLGSEVAGPATHGSAEVAS